MIIDLLRSNGSIVVNKNLVHAIGINAAIMYSELISKREYFANRDQLTEDGYFFNTVDNLKLDTGLGEKPQSAAIKNLEKLGLIKTEKRGLPAKRYFKIIDNDDLVMAILNTGKQKRLELEKELNSKNEKKKETYISNINSSTKTEELGHPDGSINNTNINNPKNNKIKRYIIISNDDYFLSYYNQKYKDKFGKEHPTITVEQLNNIQSELYQIKSDLDIDDELMEECIDYHFDNLSVGNDGKIFSFTSPNGGRGCIYRYMEEMA